MPAPQLSVEDGIAALAKTAVDTGDAQLVNIAAAIATAYGTGDRQQMETSYLQLHDYLLTAYAGGQKPPMQLLRADHALQTAVGGHQRVSDLRAARTRANRPAPAPAAPRKPVTFTPDAGSQARVAEMLRQRDARAADLADFYAHPDYQRQRQGAPDAALDEDYLKARRRLFGKRLVRPGPARR